MRGVVLVVVGCWLGAGMLVGQMAAPQPVDRFVGKPRVAIISDIGNEPDDQMSLVRLLLYSNEMDIEALVAATSVWQRTVVHPETMHKLVSAYGQVRGNLMLNAKGWPTEAELQSKIAAGQPGYGMAEVGVGKSSDGAKELERAMEREDARPLWVCLWGGANTLAQALMDVRAEHTAAETAAIVTRVRVYSISDQDDAGAWIRREFPGLMYVVMPSSQDSQEYVYATWTGISGDKYYRNGLGADMSVVTNEWLETNIRAKGPLGKMYPKFMFIMEGDTPSYLGLIDNGLNAYRRPDWGGWGGRYVYRQPHGETHPIWTQGGDEFMRATSQDAVVGLDGQTHVTDQATIWRWRDAYQNDFAARMDWTVKDFAHANHAPLLVVNGQAGTGVVDMTAKAGDVLTLDAAGSRDPDGQKLHYKWWVYKEAGLDGTHGAEVSLSGADGPQARATVAGLCRANWLPLVPCKGDGVAHVILEVTDEGTPQMTAYRRVVVTVKDGVR